MTDPYEAEAWYDFEQDQMLFKVRRFVENNKKGIIYSVPLERVETDMSVVPPAAEYPIKPLLPEPPDNSVLAAVRMLMQIARGYPEGTNEYSWDGWIREFRTIRAGTAGRGGHTTAAAALAKELDGIVLSPDWTLAGFVKNMGVSRTFSEDTVLSGGLCGMRFGALIVDNAQWFRDLPRILITAIPGMADAKDPWVILLG